MTENQNDNQEPKEFDLDSVFSKQTVKIVEDGSSPLKKEKLIKDNQKVDDVREAAVKDKMSSKKDTIEEEDDDEEEDEEDDPKTSKDEKKEPSIDYKAEFEKLQKTVKDTQRSFHEDRKKLSAYKRAVEKMKEDGVLLDEEATMLLDHTKFEEEKTEDNVIARYFNIWDKELEYMRKYASNPKEVNQSVLAFQHLLQTSSQTEIQDIISDLAQYEDDEVEFTKQMIEIGRQYNDDIFSDIYEAGSIRNLKGKYKKEIDDKQKVIDKLEKKLAKYMNKYEDYDKEPANMGLSSGSGNIDHNKDASFDIGAIFERQYQRR